MKREWSPTREYSLLIATQVIRVVVYARVRSIPTMLGVVGPVWLLLLLLLLWQTAIQATHWIHPAGSGSGRCLDAWQARDTRQPTFALRASRWVVLVCEGLAREGSLHVLLPHLLQFLEARWRPSRNISRLSLILVVLLVGTFLTIRRRSITRVGTGGRAISPRRIVRRTAVRDGIVEKGCAITKAS